MAIGIATNCRYDRKVNTKLFAFIGITYFTASFLTVGCSTMSTSECEKADWAELGHQDAFFRPPLKSQLRRKGHRLSLFRFAWSQCFRG